MKKMEKTELKDFFKVIIDNFSNHFDNCHKKAFTTQTVESCAAIYDLCYECDPENVIEIGTNHGASTLSILTALAHLNKKPVFYSIDLSHDAWKEVYEVQKDHINGLAYDTVKLITNDFNKVSPEDVIRNGKTFLFHDMHDHAGPWSLNLLNNWVPKIKDGLIAFHDFSKVDDSYVLKEDLTCPRSKLRYLNGQMYAGFGEVERIINWANNNKYKIKDFNGGIYIIKKNGIIESF